MRQGRKLSFSRKTTITSLGIVLVLVLGGFWLRFANSGSGSSIPKRVCKNIFQGDKTQNLLPDGSGKFREEASGFPRSEQMFSRESCELYRSNDELSVRAEFPGGKPSGHTGEGDRKIALGAAYGYFAKSTGTILLSVACPSTHHPKDRLLVVSGASRAESYDTTEKKRGKGVADLSRFSAYATKVLAEKEFKCRGAEKLPSGPVDFSS